MEGGGGLDWMNRRNRVLLENFVKMTTKMGYLLE